MTDTDKPAEAFALRYPRNWPSLLNRMVSLAVVPGDAPDTIRTKRLFTTAMWASLLTSVSSISLLIRDDAPLAAAATAIPFLTAAISLVAMWRDPSTYPGVMHLVAGGTIITSSAIIVMFGGIYESAGAATWSMLAVFGAVAIFADRRAHLWLAVFAGSVGTAALLSARFEPLYQVPNPESLAVFNLVVVSLFIYVILYYFVRKSDQLFHQADDLLRNVLPDEVAERLKVSGEGMIADEFESASILFADISGFSSMAAQRAPGEVVSLLNEVFTVFDDLVEERGLEKIKTIGDAYMVAAGVPVARDDHARAICDLALAMQSRLRTRRFADRDLAMRIGVASGPVTAGIIGHKKFSYDLWGDTVNLASRMESTGVPDKIQVPASTRELVEPWFEWERRGVVEARGRGEVETWFLVGAAD
jgi:adenylate cyclase